MQEGDGGRRDSVRQAKQAQPAVPIETPLWEAAAGTVRGELGAERCTFSGLLLRFRSLNTEAKILRAILDCEFNLSPFLSFLNGKLCDSYRDFHRRD